MREDELASILADKDSGIPIDEINTSALSATEATKDGVETCPECGKTFTGTHAKLALNGHLRSHGIGKKDKEKPTEALPLKENEIPTTDNYLSNLLSVFGVPNAKGVILGMQQTEPSNIARLRDLLRAVSTPVGKIEQISAMYAENLGIRQQKEEVKPMPKDAFEDIFTTQERMLRLKLMENMMGNNNNTNNNHHQNTQKDDKVAILEAQVKELKDILPIFRNLSSLILDVTQLLH